eukprot:403349868
MRHQLHTHNVTIQQTLRPCNIIVTMLSPQIQNQLVYENPSSQIISQNQSKSGIESRLTHCNFKNSNHQTTNRVASIADIWTMRKWQSDSKDFLQKYQIIQLDSNQTIELQQKYTNYQNILTNINNQSSYNDKAHQNKNSPIPRIQSTNQSHCLPSVISQSKSQCFRQHTQSLSQDHSQNQYQNDDHLQSQEKQRKVENSLDKSLELCDKIEEVRTPTGRRKNIMKSNTQIKILYSEYTKDPNWNTEKIRQLG